MSTLANWSYKEGPATVWPTGGTDDFGQPIGADPYLIPATDYEEGGEVQRDDAGNEFVPRLTVYFEAAFDSELIPKKDWYIKMGDHSDVTTRPDDAERIRAIMAWPMTKFGDNELPDWRVMT